MVCPAAGAAQLGSLMRLELGQVVISLMGVIVDMPPPMLYRLPQLLIQVPDWASPLLIQWQAGSPSPTISVLLVPSVTSAIRRTTAENANRPDTRRLSIGFISPNRGLPP